MKTKFFKISLLSVLLSIFFLCLNPMQISADTPAPNLTAINETHAWRNVIETGDFFLTARYNVVQNASTTIDISDAYLFRLMDTTNTAELGVVEAYPYQNDGYGQGVVSFYFPAASAPAWGGSYWLRIEGKFTAFTSPPVYNYNIPATTYSSYITASTIKSDIAVKILDMARTIGNSWTPTRALTEESESGTVLSIYGESYFRPAIPGLQAMCPNLFLLQITDVDTSATTWSNNESTEKAGLVQNTTMGSGVSGVATLFNMSFSATAAIPIIVVCVVLFIIGAVQENMLSGLVNSSVVLAGASLFGWFPMGVLMLITFACGVYCLFHLIFKGSS
jgi:hypothetical protein